MDYRMRWYVDTEDENVYPVEVLEKGNSETTVRFLFSDAVEKVNNAFLFDTEGTALRVLLLQLGMKVMVKEHGKATDKTKAKIQEIQEEYETYSNRYGDNN